MSAPRRGAGRGSIHSRKGRTGDLLAIIGPIPGWSSSVTTLFSGSFVSSRTASDIVRYFDHRTRAPSSSTVTSESVRAANQGRMTAAMVSRMR